ncbi:MAG: LytR C-terminal domain-containing protein [Ignavibacteria bacterium]
MKKSFLAYILNGAIILFIILVVYFGFSFINNSIKSDKSIKEITDTTKSITNQPNLTVQLDVQNGTSENGVASKFTDYLRRNGIDVVEIGNYKSKDIDKTLVIDRTGDRTKARKVAMLLGVSDKNIIEQTNNSLYLDVSVVIGKDFNDLKPYKENIK